MDLAQPVGLILMNILGHLPDLDEAVSIVRHLTNVIDGPAFEAAIAVWNANAPLSYRLRHPDELARFLTGLTVVEPGLVPCPRWRPSPEDDPAGLRDIDEFGAVAGKA